MRAAPVCVFTHVCQRQAKVDFGGEMSHLRPACTITEEIGLIFPTFVLFCSKMTVVTIGWSPIGVPARVPHLTPLHHEA